MSGPLPQHQLPVRCSSQSNSRKLCELAHLHDCRAHLPRLARTVAVDAKPELQTLVCITTANAAPTAAMGFKLKLAGGETAAAIPGHANAAAVASAIAGLGDQHGGSHVSPLELADAKKGIASASRDGQSRAT